MVKLKNLALQGAGFDHQSQKLIDPVNNAPEYSILPLAYIAWIHNTEGNPYPDEECIVIVLILGCPIVL